MRLWSKENTLKVWEFFDNISGFYSHFMKTWISVNDGRTFPRWRNFVDKMPAPAKAGDFAGACKSLEFNVLIHHSFAITWIFSYLVSHLLILILIKYNFQMYIVMCLNIFKPYSLCNHKVLIVITNYKQCMEG